MSDLKKKSELADGLSRRSFLGAGSAVLAAATFVGLTAEAQQRNDTRKAEHDHASSNPGQENKPLLAENPNSNMPPPSGTTGMWVLSGTPLTSSINELKRAAGRIR